MSFQESLKYGRVGESKIARFFARRGWSVLPVYEVEQGTGKGPRLYTASGQLIAPDMIVFNSKKVYWIEAKHKSAFAWNRTREEWVTGIDLVHYQDYCEVARRSPFPIWLLFLQEGGQAKDSPPGSNSGLYGNSLKFLQEHESHRHPGWGKGGMVYWCEDSFFKIAELDELEDN